MQETLLPQGIEALLDQEVISDDFIVKNVCMSKGRKNYQLKIYWTCAKYVKNSSNALKDL